MVAAMRRIHAFLFPPEEELGPQFMSEIQRGALRGWRVACWMSMVAGLIFIIPYRLFLTRWSPAILPPLIGAVVLGALGLLLSHTPMGRRYPRAFSVILAILIGSLLMYSQVVAGSHVYGYFGGLVLILLVMSALGTLKPAHLLLTASYFWLIYVLAGVFLDRSVGWPPPPTFVFFCATLGIAGVIAVWLNSIAHLARRTEFELRSQLERAFRELHETQAQLLVSEKAIAQTQVVAALCHELNSPLGAIVSSVGTHETVRKRLEARLAQVAEGGEEIQNLLELNQDLNQGILEASRRVAAMLDRLREFTHLDEAERKPVDLNAELLRSLELVRSEIGSGARVEKELAALPPVLAHPQKISLAFANLLRNAFQAVGQDGQIRLRSADQNSSVVITIEDNGRGIGPSELKRLFDPEFVSKAGKVRTRWGLATSRQILLQHKGSLELESTPGRGTIVKIILPLR